MSTEVDRVSADGERMAAAGAGPAGAGAGPASAAAPREGGSARTGAARMKSYEFRREREASWRELEALLRRVRRRGLRSLDASALGRLPILYRSTLSSLSVARSISLDRNLLDYLENLAGRAYLCVYGSRRHIRHAVAGFLWERFPATVRELGRPILVAAGILLTGVLVGFWLTLGDADRFFEFVPAWLRQGRGPTSTTEELRQVLFAGAHSAADLLLCFATFLFTHNAQVGILSFSLGFAMGLPVFHLLFTNGMALGALVAIYHQRGLTAPLLGWLLPHGITELTAVAICGGGGLVLAQSLLFPGRHARLHNLALNGRKAGLLILGAVVMFFVAALIEGLFRQMVQDTAVRFGVAAATTAGWSLYFSRAGRRRSRTGEGRS